MKRNFWKDLVNTCAGIETTAWRMGLDTDHLVWKERR